MLEKLKLWHALAIVSVIFAVGTVWAVIAHNQWSESADQLSAIGLVASIATILAYAWEENRYV